MLDVSRWLAEQGLGHHAEAFAANGIAGDVLRELTDADLKELGLNLGDRKRLLKAIAALDAGPTQNLLGTAEPTAARTAPRDAERRQLTVMFVDLVGSTALAARLDPEDMREVITGYQNGCSEVIRRYDGHVAKFMGDGVLAYFGYPRAHEDEAERAVRAALALVEAIGRLTSPAGGALAARIGIATGLVVVGDLVGEGAAQEQAVVGETPNLAARLQALAAPGGVVISRRTRRLVGGLFDLADLGPHDLAGFAGPVRAWRVINISTAESRFEAMHGVALTPLVGRDHELGLLLDRWELAKGGEGQVVLLSGEPGIGKTRLTRSLMERLGEEPHTCLRHFCSPYHTNSALHPVIDQLERAAGFAAGDAPEQKLAKLEAVLAEAAENVAEVAPLVAALLSIPIGARYPPATLTPQAQKARTFEALLGQVAGLAERRPLLMVFEDAHWIDPTTSELFGLVVDRIQRLRVLLVINFRPEFNPPWTGAAPITSLTLSRLGQRQGAQMVEGLTGSKALPAEVLHQILLKTDGVPLFVEELTKTVLDSGLLTDAGDHFELSGPLPPLAIPATLHDSLMARLDRLAPVKEVAQMAAAIGREFSYTLLAAVANRSEAKLKPALDQLVAAKLIYRRGAPPDTTYNFKHALVQDAAYQSLLKSKRQQLHARIAEILEQRFPDTVETEPELLASHYTAAGLTEAGVRYWERAGARATDRSAFIEAVNHYDKGLDLLRTLPEGPERTRLELSLQMGLGVALGWTRGYAAAAVEAAYGRAHVLARQMGESPELFRILWGLWHFFIIRGDLGKAQQLSREFAQLGQRLRDPSLAPHIHRALGETALFRGEFVAAQRETSKCFIDTVLPPPKRIPGLQDPLVMCGAWLALALWHLGYPDQALVRVGAALERAKGSPFPGDLGGALLFATLVRLLRRETKTARECAETAFRFNSERGRILQAAISDTMLGSILVADEHDLSGLTHIRNGIAGTMATGAGLLRPWFLTLLAGAHGHFGEYAAGLAALAEAESRIGQSAERWPEAEIHRLKGELMLSMEGADATAERCFRRSIEVACEQQAKSPELRAATSLARLWRDRGKRAEGRDLLAPVYGWFTEGFDTADLKDAEALLGELA